MALGLTAFLWCAGLLAHGARSAQISVSSDGGPSLITIKGELDLADAVEFLRETAELKDAVVILQSPGGNAVAGIQIGRSIRQKGFLTVVPAATNCASACALAWLGGTPRFMAEDSQIGFHAAYFVKGGRPRKNKAATELMAAYLKGISLPRTAIAHITGAPPEKLYWLTISAARGLGIEAGIYTSEGITSTLDRAPSSPAIKRIGSVDILGADFPGMPMRNVSADECEARCKDNDDCAAYTFNQRRSACFLKSRAELTVGYPAAISGYRATGEHLIRHIDMTILEATDFPGNDIGRRKQATFKACLLACSKTASCRAFTYVARSRECWLKNAIGSAEPQSGVVSGAK